MRIGKILLSISLAILLTAVASPCQSSDPDVPMIIRDTDIAEGVVQEEPPKERDPAEAQKNIKIGNFYRKHKNYVGAIGRYLTALEYQPDSDQAYEELIGAYKSLIELLDEGSLEPREISEQIQQTVDSLESYILNTPESPLHAEFREKVETLLEKKP
ncbi:MAG: hypothetical protein P8Z37_09940 [Acidobacteriota bacterium]|jgi:hypothetical protein